VRCPAWALVALTVTPTFFTTSAHAVDPFEVQVYEGDINDPLQAGVELHSNFTVVGRSDPAFMGEVVPDGLLRVTLEPSMGILSWWEIGVYLQTAFQPSEPDGHFAGFKLRSKFIVPRQRTGEFILGLNIEVGRGVAALGTADWDTEVRPIIAWLRGRWILAVNPIIGWALTGDRHVAPHLEPAFKVRVAAAQHVGLGVEYYADFGVLSALPAADRQEHVMYVIGDLLNGPIELNIGVGRGLTGATDAWTIKTIIGHAF
jgi:hypothetical protein